MEANGPYYGVVLNAGIARDNAFPAMTGEDWDAVLRTNLDGFYNVLQPAIMPMVSARRGGRIVTLSSVSGLAGNRGQVNYSAAKAGIIGATKALALELAKRNITVNCVAPGLIETDMIADVPMDEAIEDDPDAPRRPARRSRGRGVLPVLRRRRLRHAAGHLRQWRNAVMRRVVVTGMGGVTALGNDWPSIRPHLEAGRTAIRHMPDWQRYDGVNTRLAAPIPDRRDGRPLSAQEDAHAWVPSRDGRRATERAPDDAGLHGQPVLQRAQWASAYGSSFGTPRPSRASPS